VRVRVQLVDTRFPEFLLSALFLRVFFLGVLFVRVLFVRVLFVRVLFVRGGGLCGKESVFSKATRCGMIAVIATG
jgi:hypothetical protein